MNQITAYEVRNDEKDYFEELSKQLNIKIVYSSKALTENTLSLCKDSKAITILGQSRIDSSILKQLKAQGILAVATRTVGYNHIDIVAATKLSIKVSNASYAPNGVADYTVMLMLMLLRKYKQAMYRANVNDYSLPGLCGKEMKDLTIGIIGTGSIGQQVIENLSGFGCKLLAYNKSEKDSVKNFAQYVSLDELYKQADIIS